MDIILANTRTKLEMIDLWCKRHHKTLEDFLELDEKFDLLGIIDLGCFEFNDRPLQESVDTLDEIIRERIKDDRVDK